MATDTQKPDAQSTSSDSGNNTSAATPIREIPIVPPTDRINLNETIVDIVTKLDRLKEGE